MFLVETEEHRIHVRKFWRVLLEVLLKKLKNRKNQNFHFSEDRLQFVAGRTPRSFLKDLLI